MNSSLMFYRCSFVLVLLGLLAPAVEGQPSLQHVGPPGEAVIDLAVTSTGQSGSEEWYLLDGDRLEHLENVSRIVLDPATPDRLLVVQDPPG
jgi:hypothetical protein